jgi:hypothetical protein
MDRLPGSLRRKAATVAFWFRPEYANLKCTAVAAAVAQVMERVQGSLHAVCVQRRFTFPAAAAVAALLLRSGTWSACRAA